jgi:hypothetical protein
MRPTRFTWNSFAVLALINVFACGVFMTSRYIRHIARFEGDYRAYYSAGHLARESRFRVYEWQAQKADQAQQYGDALLTPFYHPPLELVMFAPLSKLPYPISLNIWRAFSLLMLGTSGWLLARATGSGLKWAMFLAAAQYGVFVCVVMGQDGLVEMLLVSGSFLLLREGKDMAAGSVLSILAGFKPELAVVLGIAMLAFRRFRFVIGLCGTALPITIGCLCYMGRTGIANLINDVSAGEQTSKIVMMPTIRGLIARSLRGDHHVITALLLVGIIGAFIPVWRRSSSVEFVFSSALCVFAFTGWHVFSYDLGFLAIPVMLVIDRPTRADAALVAVLCSDILFVVLNALDFASLYAVPAMILCAMCFRLNRGNTESQSARSVELSACEAALP